MKRDTTSDQTGATKMKKGSTVFYQNRTGTFRARVETRHRDGSVTIRTLFWVDDEGHDVPGYIGYPFRLDPAALRTSFAA